MKASEGGTIESGSLPRTHPVSNFIVWPRGIGPRNFGPGSSIDGVEARRGRGPRSVGLRSRICGPHSRRTIQTSLVQPIRPPRCRAPAIHSSPHMNMRTSGTGRHTEIRTADSSTRTLRERHPRRSKGRRSASAATASRSRPRVPRRRPRASASRWAGAAPRPRRRPTSST